MPLFRRVILVNAIVFATALVALALSPATISDPVARSELAILVVLFSAVLALNVILIHRVVAPLESLREAMRAVDLLGSTERLRPTGTAETVEVAHAFNDMLDRLADERRRSSRGTLAAQEAERQRIARELHDELGQGLTAHLLHLSRIAKEAPDAVRESVLEAREDARHLLDESRRLASQLRPEALDDLGLPSALAALAREVRRRTGVRVRAEIDEDVPALTPEAELVVYRVAQEALTNAVRHSGAERAHLHLRRENGGVVLRVRDEGFGLDGAQPGGGMRGMRERALTIAAGLHVESADPNGVEVRLDVPESEFLCPSR